MLQYLKIKNLALLEEVTLEFDSGFTAVTGETGAGKSVLLGALSLLSGGRADKTLIRQGADQLEVEGALYFADTGVVDALLDSFGLPLCEDGVLLLKRRISREKMPKIQVNGSMATLAQLKKLGETWIDFHGPGEPQKLFNERYQLSMLDLYAGNVDLLVEYGKHYDEWCMVEKEINRLKNSEQLSGEEAEFLRKQIDQIDRLQLSEASVQALENEYTRMANAQELQLLVSQISATLSDDQGLTDQLNKMVAHYESLAALDSTTVPLLERARSVMIELVDLGDETAQLAADFDFDAESIEATNEQMNLWQELRRKHGSSVEAVIAKRNELAQTLSNQGDIESAVQQKEAAAQALQKTLRAEADKLRVQRESAATKLTQKVMTILPALGFKKARLEIEITDEPELKEYGSNSCRSLFAPNAGQTLLPLSKIASSGEMARVMLALKTVLAEADATPVLVFDEVDANVGGEVGRAVGSELAKLSSRHQIFSVTHLPQVAASAQQHFVVTKVQSTASTNVSIEPVHLDQKLRLEEVARMLGDRHSESARAHAESLLE